MWKLIWKELFVYTLTFLSISLVYRHGLTEDQQKTMEQLIIWCRQQSTGELLSQGGEGRGGVVNNIFTLILGCLSTSKPILVISIGSGRTKLTGQVCP